MRRPKRLRSGTRREDFVRLAAVAGKIARSPSARELRDRRGAPAWVVEEQEETPVLLKVAATFSGDVGGFADAAEDKFSAGGNRGLDGAGGGDEISVQTPGPWRSALHLRYGNSGARGRGRISEQMAIYDLNRGDGAAERTAGRAAFNPFHPFPMSQYSKSLSALALLAFASASAGCGPGESLTLGAEARDDSAYREGEQLGEQGRPQEALGEFPPRDCPPGRVRRPNPASLRG